MSQFHALKIKDVRRETADAVSIAFDVPDDIKQLFAFQPGQHIALKTEIAGDEIRRNYSICVAPHENELRVAIKQVTGGLFSTYANQTLAKGDTIDILPPSGSFTWDINATSENHYVGLAAGSGITPVFSLLKSILGVEANSTFTLFYGNRDSASVIFLDEIAALKDQYLNRLRIFHVLEREEDEIDLFNGRLDREKCAMLLATIPEIKSVSAFFVCGPASMMDACEASLHENGINKDRIFIERFSAGILSEAQKKAALKLEEKAVGLSFTVVLEGRRNTIAFDAKAGNILDSARKSGLPAPYACKGGVCATCRAKVISGTVDMKMNYGLTPQEVEQGYVLTCQSVPTSEGVVVSYEA